MRRIITYGGCVKNDAPSLYVVSFPLLQLLVPEVEHLGEDVVAGVAAVDAVVAVGVVEHVELLVGLYQCLRVLYAVAHVHVVVGQSMHEQQATVEVGGTAHG